jgi:hypothetical protein
VAEAALARPTGRRRPLPVRAVLAALVCLALDDRPLFITEATRVLFCQLSPPGPAHVPGTAATRQEFQAAYVGPLPLPRDSLGDGPLPCRRTGG